MRVLHALPPLLEQRLETAMRPLGASMVRATPDRPEGNEPEAITVVVVGAGMSCDAARMERLPALSGIVAVGSGTDTIDVDAATARGIAVAHAPTPENFTGMAEATVMLMLAATFDLPAAMANMRRPSRRNARMLAGKTIGLIGTGRIAQAVARRLASWDLHLLAFSRRADAVAPPGTTLTDFDSLIRHSDIISLHVALSPETRGLIGRAELAAMKPDAILINTARGSLVDEAALSEALHAGRLRGAALDVFAQEPLHDDSPLWQAPRLITTPHSVGHTDEGRAALAEALIGNVQRLLTGKRPLYPFNAPARLLGT